MNLLAAAAVLLVLRQMLKGRKPAPAAVADPSRLLPVLAAAAAVMGVTWWETTRPATKVITAPAPRPVIVTAPPKPAPTHFAWPHIALHLSGTDWTVITVAALLVTYALVRPLLHRSAS